MIDSEDSTDRSPAWGWLCDKLGIVITAKRADAVSLDDLKVIWEALGLMSEGYIVPHLNPSLWRIWDLSEIAKIHE